MSAPAEEISPHLSRSSGTDQNLADLRALLLDSPALPPLVAADPAALQARLWQFQRRHQLEAELDQFSSIQPCDVSRTDLSLALAQLRQQARRTSDELLQEALHGFRALAALLSEPQLPETDCEDLLARVARVFPSNIVTAARERQLQLVSGQNAPSPQFSN